MLEDLIRLSSGTEYFHCMVLSDALKVCAMPCTGVFPEAEAGGVRLYKAPCASIRMLCAQHIRTCIPSEPETSLCCSGIKNESL